VLGGKRLKSPSGFQSERCHQHMCSRHVGGGGSINEGASLSDLLRVTPHSGNFISHNRALKPPFRTSFTPTAAPHRFPSLLPPVRPHLSFSVSFDEALPSFFRPSNRQCGSSRASPFSLLPALPRLRAFIPLPSVDPSPASCPSSSPIVFLSLSFSLSPSPSFSPLPSDSNAHQRQYLTALTVG